MAAADAQAVLADPNAFEQLVASLLQADNTARKHGEAVFEEVKKNPDGCVSHLMRCLRQSASEEHRAFSAIMLRKVLTRDEPTMYAASSPQVQLAVKQELLAALAAEPSGSVRKKVGDTVSELASELLDKGEWPEVLPALVERIQSGQPQAMEASLAILATLAAYSTDSLRPHLAQLHPILGACLGHAALDVQVAALHVVAGFIQQLEEPKERDAFQPMVPALLATLGRCLTAEDEQSAQEVLEQLIEVAEQHPKFLKKQLGEVIAAMLQIANAGQLDPPTRTLAVEFMVTLCEARERAPGMMRKLPEFVPTLFAALMGFLLDVEDDALWHGADSDAHEEEGCGELFDSGQEFLDRIAISLGGKALVPAAGALLPAWLQDGADWRKRHAALICLAQIAEGCAKVMLEQLQPLVMMCLQGLSDPHPRVRWSACQALGQMCTDLTPDIQEIYGAQILPALMAAMDDFSNPRVQAHAAAAVVNFSEGSEADLMGPHLDVLITKLLTLLQRGKKLVQEGALTAIASVADSSEDMFVKYYDAVMPLLSSILLNAQDKQHRLLRAKALECISLVGMAVGRERFRGDAAHVMGFLQQLQGADMDPDDPTSSYMLQAGARLCKALGPEFLPYLGVVMPPLLKTAALEPDVKITDADDVDDDEDDDDVEYINLGDKLVAIRTSTLEEKATACSMIGCYVDELKEGFFPYVKQVADIMVPLLKFYFHEDVRRAAVQSVPQLLRSADLACERGAPGASREFVSQLFAYTWEPLVAALKKEPEADIQATMLESIAEVVDLVEPALISQPQVEAAFEGLRHVLKQAERRREARLKRLQQEDFDEEEAEALREENECEEELVDQVTTAIGSFLKRFGDAVLPYVESLMPHIAPLLDKSRSEEERRIALCVVDDLLEHSPAGRAKYAPQVLPVLLDACGAAHADLRQCAAYGVGVVAGRAPEVLRPHAQAALMAVMAVINGPDARGDDNEMATDNAVSALGLLLQHHADALDGAAVGAAWVAALPIKGDAVEGVRAHAQLVAMMEAQDPRVLGAGGKHIPHLAGVLVQVLGRGSDLVDAETAPRAAKIVAALRADANYAAAVDAAFAALSDKHKANFTAHMAGP
ncbi:MAG: armadillo-type protein [Monoraphidium minutum]|nr:MAG: armadillo-type protein [Monoraphidium minutum]